MKKIIHIHIPDLPWSALMSEYADVHLPHFIQLIENGTSGKMPPVGPAPVIDGILATARSPRDNGLLTRHSIKPDGFGTAIATHQIFNTPTLWELLDINGVNGAVVNLRATTSSELNNGSIISDRFGEIYTRTRDDWGIPPGSISPLSLIHTLEQYRLHPDELSKDHLAPFIARLQTTQKTTQSIDEKEIRIIARTLAENSTVHAISTWILEQSKPDYLFLRYHALEQLVPHFKNSPPDKSLPGGFMELLDAFLARLIHLAHQKYIFFITGGEVESPFWIASGTGIKADQLFPEQTSLYDLPVSILAFFGFEALKKMPGKVPYQVFDECIFTQKQSLRTEKKENNKLASAHKIIPELVKKGFIPPIPSLDQSALIVQQKFREKFMLAENAFYEKRLTDAINFYQQAIKIKPQEKLPLFRLCQILAHDEQLDTLENFLQKIPVENKNNFWVSSIQTKVVLLKGNQPLAEKMTKQLALQASTQEEKKQLSDLLAAHPCLSGFSNMPK